MHRDLLQWEQALKLASRFSPKDLPVISREYAQQLEFQ
jgi:WD repeat-containing protein 19